MAIMSGNLMKRQEGHISTGRLKDGRQLSGRVFWERTGAHTARIKFNPNKVQPDGSKWVNECARHNNAELPTDVNVYRDEMLDMASISFSDPARAHLEPAIAKILLGIMYLARGKEALQLPGFNALRNCLNGSLDPRVAVTCTTLDTIRDKVPFDFGGSDHSVWGHCLDGEIFFGGVSLFGRVVAEVSIEGFWSILEGRVVHTPNDWLPPLIGANQARP